MKLGNSFGNNRGKKYMMRGKHDKTPCVGGVEKAADFTEWFSDTYHSLVDEQINKGSLDYDVMNETYIRMYEGIMYGNMNVNDYRSYFSRAYFTNLIQGRIQQNRYFSLADNYDTEQDAGYDFELEKRQKQLEEDIFAYVYESYKLREFELFKMYMSLKPAINYQILSDITGLKVHQIQSTISKIKRDICANNSFVSRRRELVA